MLTPRTHTPWWAALIVLVLVQGIATAGVIEVTRTKHKPGEWVYRCSGVGHTECYDDGIDELNAYLKQEKNAKILLLPGPGSISTLDGAKTLFCTWMKTKTNYSAFFPDYSAFFVGGSINDVLLLPEAITVYTDDESIPLQQLEIPEDAQVYGPRDLHYRSLEGMKSDNRYVQAACARQLVQCDPYDTGNVFPLQQLMNRAWHMDVHSTAALALGKMGSRANAALPLLRWHADANKEKPDAYRTAIAQITESPDLSAEADAYAKAIDRIQLYIKTTRPDKNTNIGGLNTQL